jgi:hypothetical protein
VLGRVSWPTAVYARDRHVVCRSFVNRSADPNWDGGVRSSMGTYEAVENS